MRFSATRSWSNDREHGGELDGLLGWFGGVLGCNTKEAFAGVRLTVGVPNELQMTRNLTGGLPVLYQGQLTRLCLFRECSTPAHERDKRGAPVHVGVSDCKTGNGENARMHETNTYSDEMHMMT